MKVLLLTPPMVQLNTPYPATAYLTGFLRQQSDEMGEDHKSIKVVYEAERASGHKAVFFVKRGEFAKKG